MSLPSTLEPALVVAPEIDDRERSDADDRSVASLMTSSANLNLLRAFAVILVVQDHLLTFLFGTPHWYFIEPTLLGRAGVLIFFVHTSLVLMFSLERQQERFGANALIRIFMTRRIFRIMPLSFLAVVLTYSLHLPLGSISPRYFESVNSTASGFAENLFLVQNFFKIGSIIAPLWSLPYEMQMYLLLPVLYVVVRRFRQFDGPLFLWALVGFALIVLQHHVDQVNHRIPVVQVPEWLLYIPCFLPGIIAWRTGMGRERLRRLSAAWLVIFLAAMCTWYMLSYDRTKFIFFALVLGVTLPYYRECRVAWLGKAGAVIARYSYGIYLFHSLSIWFAFDRLRGNPSIVQWVVFLVTLAGIPVLLYHAVESPMIRMGNRLVARKYRDTASVSPELLTAPAP